MTITNITPRETELQRALSLARGEASVWKDQVTYDQAELKTVWRMNDALKAEVADLKAKQSAYISRTGARILALHEELGELKAKLAETEQARALIMQTLANTVIERDALKAKLAEASMTAVPNPRVIEIYDTCDQHPDAPHGYLRDASHNAGRYVCECEFWTPGEEL